MEKFLGCDVDFFHDEGIAEIKSKQNPFKVMILILRLKRI